MKGKGEPKELKIKFFKKVSASFGKTQLGTFIICTRGRISISIV